MRIRYANARKLRAQMAKRGWTEEQIIEALQTTGIAARGKKGPATRYIQPRTGRSVVVDDATGAVIHVGGDGFEYPN
jgi:Colicin E5 ribonuclease domain